MADLAETLRAVVADLRSADTVLEHVADPQAIDEGPPSNRPDYPAAITVTPVYDGSTPASHDGIVQTDHRIQVTVSTTTAWRTERSNEAGTSPLAAQYEILDAVAGRLDRARGTTKVPLGGEGGPTPMPADGGLVAVHADWRLRGFVPADDA